MKSTIFALFGAGILAISGQALAEFTPAKLLSATETAVTAFLTDQAAHAVGFTGYKAWKSGADARVKVYVTHGGSNMEFNYLCHEHDAEIECHAQ